MKKLLAIWVGKAVILLGKLLHRTTTASPGEFALKIYPRLICDLKKHISKSIIVTCGTNGKTTTNNLLCTALEAKGYKVICNKTGANMLSGVATVYLEATNIFGKFKADYACFEIDEAYTRVVFNYFSPDVLVVTNLFRDQLDRYGEIDITASLIKEAISKCPSLKIVLNGDDPISAQFGLEKNVTPLYFGVSEAVLEQKEGAKEGGFCPVCSSQLGYGFNHYSQLGDFYCTACDYKHPHLDVNATDVSLNNPMTFKINGNTITVNHRGFYSIYNLIAVYGALLAAGEDVTDFEKLIEAYKPQTGRMQEFNFNKTVVLSLSKNPAGFNQAIDTVNNDTRKKDVIIAINDKVSDGRDISWMWDVDFENIKNESLNTLSISGKRLWDLALRFKYCDITPDLVSEDMAMAVKNALASDSEVVYFIANYTALYEADKVLNNLMKEKTNEN